MVSLNERINARGRVEVKRARRGLATCSTSDLLHQQALAVNNRSLMEPTGWRWAWCAEWQYVRRMLRADPFDLYSEVSFADRRPR